MRAMEHTVRLDVGAEVRCPHCHRWHPVIAGHTEGTDYTLRIIKAPVPPCLDRRAQSAAARQSLPQSTPQRT